MAVASARVPASVQWFAKVYVAESGDEQRKVGEIPLGGTLSESFAQLDVALRDAPEGHSERISRITFVKRAATAAKLAWEAKPRKARPTATK